MTFFLLFCLFRTVSKKLIGFYLLFFPKNGTGLWTTKIKANVSIITQSKKQIIALRIRGVIYLLYWQRSPLLGEIQTDNIKKCIRNAAKHQFD